jgi:hypothetical protein
MTEVGVPTPAEPQTKRTVSSLQRDAASQGSPAVNDISTSTVLAASATSSGAVRPEISRPMRLISQASAPGPSKPSAASSDAEIIRSALRHPETHGHAISTSEDARPVVAAPVPVGAKATRAPGSQVFLGWLAAKATAEAETGGQVPAGQRILVSLPEEPTLPEIKVEEREDVDVQVSTDQTRSASGSDGRLGVKDSDVVASIRRSSPFSERMRSGGMLDVPGVRRPLTPGRRKRKDRGPSRVEVGLEASDKENVDVGGHNDDEIDELALLGVGKAGRNSKKRKMKKAYVHSHKSPPPTPTSLARHDAQSDDRSYLVGWGASRTEGTGGKSWKKARKSVSNQAAEAWTLVNHVLTTP